VHLLVVLGNRFDVAVPARFTLLRHTDFPRLLCLLGVGTIHICAHESAVVGLAERPWVNLAPQERNLALVLHRLLDLSHDSVLVALVVLKDEGSGVDGASELGLCLVHGATALMWLVCAVTCTCEVCLRHLVR